MRHYRFEETCSGCPHQFDVWDGDTRVAYVRYRWGYLRVCPYKPEKFIVKSEWTGKETEEQEIDWETTIFDKEFGDSMSGLIPYDKEEKILDKLDREIQKYYNNSSKENEDKEWYDE